MNIKKACIALLVICLLFGITACKPAETSQTDVPDVEDKEVKLSVLAWMPEYPDLMEQWAEGFNKQHPNYTADIILMADSSSILQTKMASNDMPDAMSLTSGAFAWTVVDGGFTRDLSDTKSWKALLPTMQEEGTSPGGVAGVVAQGLCSTFIYYNADVFKECGITEFPTNYDEFLEVCQVLKDNGHTPISFPGADPNTIGNTTYSYALANVLLKGDSSVQESIADGSYDWDANENSLADAYRRTVELTSLGFCNEGYQGTDGTTYLTLFVSGDAAMVFAGTWNAGNILDGGANFEIACAPAPWNDKGEEMIGCISGETGWGLGKNEDPAVDAAAVAWLDYMSIGKGYQDYQNLAGTCCMLTPAAIKEYNLNLVVDDRISKALNDIQSHKCVSLYFNYMPAVLGGKQRYFSEIMIGDLTAEQAAKNGIADIKNAE
mgnify:FL=1